MKRNLGMGIGGLIVFGCVLVNREIYRTNMSNVTALADTNRDDVTSKDEWKAVYNELGYFYDKTNPRKLHMDDLFKYLDNHRYSTNKFESPKP